jgi:hypothetical protein
MTETNRLLDVNNSSTSSVANEGGARVLDLQAFRAKKFYAGERKSGVSSTFRALPTSQPATFKPGIEQDSDLAERIERIKSSINRINQLMTELRTMSDSDKKNK